jgi:hypothetical protein
MYTSKSNDYSPTGTKIKTTGFIIENIDQFLPDFNTDPLLLGWLFKFAGPANMSKPRNQYEIAGISIKEIRLNQAGAIYQMAVNDLKTTNGVSPTITPVMHIQEKDPVETALTDPYTTLLTVTQSEYYEVNTNSGPALISDMGEYKCWVDATFIRATDLRLLKAYLQNQVSGYHDVFFSGAKLNYSEMHNARLRVEQHWLPLTPDCTGAAKGDLSGDDKIVEGKDGDYLRTSKSFTLKAEPIVVNNDVSRTGGGTDGGDGDSDPGSGNGGAYQFGGNSSNGTATGVNGMLPSSFLMVSCPKVWDIMRAINEAAALATNSAAIGIGDLGQDVPNSLDGMLQSLDTNLQSVLNNLPIPENQASGTALANFLRALADWIDSLFTTGNT